MTPPDCATCQRPMQGHDTTTLCRWYGLPISPALAEDCKKYVANDQPFYIDAWAVG